MFSRHGVTVCVYGTDELCDGKGELVVKGWNPSNDYLA